MRPRLCVYLSGGLGNQMFQYATARALALNSNADLLIDSWSGFVRDKEYKRSFELGRLRIQAQRVGVWDQVRLWGYKLQVRLCRLKPAMYTTRWYGNFFYETEFLFQQGVYRQEIVSTTWLIGYWQSPKYFDSYRRSIQQELLPSTPTDQRFISLGLDIDSCDSVALGIRLYEESADPSAHALAGQVKTKDEINDAIKRLCTARPHARFYVFCTHRAVALSKLNLPADSVFVTADDGYDDAVNNLWLLTRCKHHIFTNSSYYWWGAWLSEGIHKKEEQLIYAADNFINIDGFCDHWRRF
jgi:hypothetical protein